MSYSVELLFQEVVKKKSIKILYNKGLRAKQILAYFKSIFTTFTECQQ